MRVIKRSEFDSLLRKIKKITAGGGGHAIGDMLKSVYDSNDDGVVDNSDKLDGQHASAFASADHTHTGYMEKATYDANNDEVIDLSEKTIDIDCIDGGTF